MIPHSLNRLRHLLEKNMKVNKNYICKRVLDNDILIDIKNNSKVVYKLNETSKYIFDLIVDGETLEEIINDVKVRYNIDLVTASRDVTEFIDKLEQLKVVKQ